MTVGCFGIILALGACSLTTETPEERAQRVEKRAKREQERKQEQAEKALKEQQPSEEELKATAAEYGIRYQSDWGNSYTVSASEMGDKWPFIHDSATVYCKITDYGRPLVAIEFNNGGLMYGLNGVALGKENMQNVSELMRRNEYGTYAAPVDNLIKRAIDNCAQR